MNNMKYFSNFIGKTIDIDPNTDQRGIASEIEKISSNYLIENFNAISASSVRSIEDVKINNIHIDIKAQDINRRFSMPNLISIDRLRRNKGKLISKEMIIRYVFFKYSKTENIIKITDVNEFNIQEIQWESLQISNLGLGQLQIKYAKKDIILNPDNLIEDWFDNLHDEAEQFFSKQIIKFKNLQREWREYGYDR